MIWMLMASCGVALVQPTGGGGAAGGESRPTGRLGPMITEVYYAVGPGAGGDANGDGVREANGDEFVELVNPHGVAINLKGWTISGKPPRSGGGGGEGGGEGRGGGGGEGGRAGGGGGGRGGGGGGQERRAEDFQQIKFTFPDVTLEPGQVVVVFNGRGAKWEGPVGDSSAGPSGGNPKFGGALVFSMKVTAGAAGWGNQRDYVLLSDPDGRAVSCVLWGDQRPPTGASPEVVDVVRGQSVQRESKEGKLVPHANIDGSMFSPGRFAVRGSGGGVSP